MISIQEIDYGSYKSVVGFVDKREVIAMDNNIHGKWGVSTSAILPWEREKACEILECFNQVFAKVELLGSES